MPRGRLWVLAKMQHWARDIGMADLDIVRAERRKFGSRVEKLKTLEPGHPTEQFNLLHVQFVELLRHSVSGTPLAEEPLNDLFDGQYLPEFLRLSNAIKNRGVTGLDQEITPSTTLSVALHTSIFAARAKRGDSSDLIRRARLIYDAGYKTSRGQVTVLTTNPETQKEVGRLAGGKWAAEIPTFEFTTNVSAPSCAVLLDYAVKILNSVDGCLPRPVAV
jgi:hypothetical protein